MSKIGKSINVYNKIEILKDIRRQGWIDLKIPGRIESVAEHCFAMSNLAILINYENNLGLNMAKVLTMISIHEYGEAKIGDISTEDHTFSKAEKYDKELNAVSEIMIDHPGRASIIDLWKEFEAKKTNEAIFVSLLDKYQSVLQAKEYAQKYNRKDVYEEFSNYYDHLLENPCYAKFSKLLIIEYLDETAENTNI